MSKSKIWYVKIGEYYEGTRLDRIYASYDEALKRYEELVNKAKRHYDRIELWAANLDTQKYNTIKYWDRDEWEEAHE